MNPSPANWRETAYSLTGSKAKSSVIGIRRPCLTRRASREIWKPPISPCGNVTSAAPPQQISRSNADAGLIDPLPAPSLLNRNTRENASPRLRQDQPDRAALIAFGNIEGGGIPRARADAILKRRQLVHDVLNHKLYAEMLQIVILEAVAGVVTERDVECILSRINIRVVA